MNSFAILLASLSLQDPVTLSSIRDRGLKIPSLPTPMKLAVVMLDVEGEVTGETPEATLKEVRDYYERVSRGKLVVKAESWGRYASYLPHEALAKMKSGSADEGEFVGAVLADARRRNPDKGTDVTLILTPRQGAARDFFLWPHAGLTDRRRYVVSWADAPMGVHAHELGHHLGLADDYALKSQEEGKWCLMSLGYKEGVPAGTAPSTLCAPCRTRLRWTARYATAAPRTAFDIDAAADVGLPEGSLLVEWREDRFLVWRESSRETKLAGQVTKEKPLTIYGATLTLEEGKAPVLKWEALPKPPRHVDVVDPRKGSGARDQGSGSKALNPGP